jgi:hypothetical protein
MKFFLPLATNDVQAERIYTRISDRLKGMGYIITIHRVYKVIYRQGEKLISETVGAASDNGEIVLAIFKNDIGYFVCTYSCGAVWGEPIVARYTVTEAADFFDGEPNLHVGEPG